MRLNIYPLSAIFVFAGILVSPPLVFPGPRDVDGLMRDAAASQCAERIEKWFPPITVRTQELDLDHVKISVVEGAQVFIPLKNPHGQVKTIYWHLKDMNEALDMIRLLQHGQIAGANLLPFRHDPVALYELRTDLIDEMKGCHNKEQVQEVLGLCVECRVREWLDVKP